METETSSRVNCDLCSSGDSTPIGYDPRVHVCNACGFVFVPIRRSAAEIARSWDEVYSSGAYDPSWPGVRARLYYVAEWLDQKIGFEGKSVLDIGAGDGFFLEQCKLRGAHVAGIDPSPVNCARIRQRDIFAFEGAVEDFGAFGTYDLVTLNWTLENCGDLKSMLGFARNCLAYDGHLSVATGSRIMSGFRKPISSYFNLDIEADLHCFHWSLNSLKSAFWMHGIGDAYNNDFDENDNMILAGPKANTPDVVVQQKAVDVISFFKDWQSQWP